MALQLSDSGAIFMLWTDLETTGSELGEGDEIIEIGSILTNFKFEEVGEGFHATIEPTEFALGRLIKNDVVREMHTANGLLPECISGMARKKDIEEAQDSMLNWMDYTINRKSNRGPVNKFRFQLAGSGVSHFDRKFIDKYMPKLSKLLIFRPYDITHVRQALRYAGVVPSADNSKSKDHRALGDIQLHLEEARAYNNMFSNLLGRKAKEKCGHCGQDNLACTPDPKHPGFWFCAHPDAERLSGRTQKKVEQ